METLTKIIYNDINQFVIDINRNFAVLQNSPLYKGIPGKKITGSPGLKGIRGSQFLFVSYAQFATKFPTELTLASQIDLNFLNSKLTFLDKQKLLSIFEITEFVNNDIIVLTNSIMIKYNILTNSFIDTKIAFNTQSNLLSSIETQIQDIIIQQLALNPILNTTNIFITYPTYSTSLQQNSNLPITNPETAVYEPYLNGTANGILLTNHNYYGYPESTFKENSDGTIVFGSIRKYFNLVEGTINDINSLTSDYAPSINNIPSVVFLQDTPNNGILFGLKTKLDLKTFGSIYKDSDDNVVIKSDSGNLVGDFSKLLINKVRLKYDKYVEFGDYLWISGNLIVDGSISNPFIRTNQYIGTGYTNTIEIGKISSGSTQRNVSDNIQLIKFNNRVLVTDSIGSISKSYSVENVMIPMVKTIRTYSDLYIIGNYPTVINSDKRFITSNYLTFIYDKFNAVIKAITEISGLSENIYTKTDFTNGLVVDIVNTGIIKNSGSFYLGYFEDGSLIKGIVEDNAVNIGYNTSSTTTIQGSTFIDIKSKILQTDNNGKIFGNCSFNDFTIPTIGLNNSLIIGNIIKSILNVNFNNNTIQIGTDLLSNLSIKGSTILSDIKNKILYTDVNGKIINTYDFNDFTIPSISLNSSLNIGSINSQILKADFIYNKVCLGYNSSSETIVSGYFKPLANNIKAVMVVGADNNIATGVSEYSICEINDTPSFQNDINRYILDNEFTNSRKETKILNGLQFNWIIETLNDLRSRDSGMRFLGNISLTINGSGQLITTLNSIGTNILNGINGAIATKQMTGLYDVKVYQDSGTTHQILLTKTKYFVTWSLIDPKVVTVGISEDNRIICKIEGNVDLSVNYPIVLSIFEITSPTFS